MLLFALIVLSGTPDAGTLMVEGSADYSRTLKIVLEHKSGKITTDALKKKIVALQLPPHPLGCGYTMIPGPAPPPGVPFNPALMPSDWVGTFGEVAMTYWRGDLSQENYDALHKAAHGTRKDFPNCKR